MPRHTQEIQPYQFNDDGTHPYTKKTRLWLRGLPLLVPTTPGCKPAGPYVPAGTGRKNREKYGAAKRGEDAKNRAKTFSGIARAMAEQWAGHCDKCAYLPQCSTDDGFKFPALAWCMKRKAEIMKEMEEDAE